MATRRWTCPVCHAGRLDHDSGRLICPACRASYPIVDERPVLIAPGHRVFPPEAYLRGAREPKHHSRWRGVVPTPSVNLSAERCLQKLGTLLNAELPGILIVGAGLQRAGVIASMGLNRPIDVVAVDVDRSADVDAWCDAHDLPFEDASFDAAVVTAVLEHVLRPERVVAEIARVLRPAGLIYSEVPFMQQVHEGAYDFTRYSLSGHRLLLDAFEEIESGPVAGPGTALAWSLEHFALALVGRPRLRNTTKAAVRLTTAWLARLDRRLADRPAGLDGASCTYFLGRLRAEGRTSDAEIVAGYRGAQRLTHV